MLTYDLLRVGKRRGGLAHRGTRCLEPVELCLKLLHLALAIVHHRTNKGGARVAQRPPRRSRVAAPHRLLPQHPSVYSAYVGIRQHTRRSRVAAPQRLLRVPRLSIRQHTSAYVSIRSIRQYTSAYVSIRRIASCASDQEQPVKALLRLC
jgi:hypothetical protein